ncbi:hypothetical protein Lser_V15G00329 [Lactuca serriola]
MTDEEWKAEAKLNKMVEKLRNAPLLYPDLCTQLFDGATSTDAASWGPSSTLLHPAEVFTTQYCEDIEMVDTPPQMDIPASASTVPPPTSASHASGDSSARSKNKRGKRNAPAETLDDDIREVGKEIMKAAQAFAQTNNLDKEMDECIEKLKGLELDNSDPKYITALMLFAENAGHNERFRAVKERFHHSIQTIHQCFHEVLKAMMCFAREIIIPTSSNTTRNTSERHRRLKNIFPGALGALDGALVHVVVPVDEQIRYKGRGKDKYYLCDAAYTNTRGFMAPYRITRYWLANFRRNGALTKEERFNNAHAQLRNIIEHGYGVLKAIFPILKRMAPYPFSVQRDIVIVCVVVHNFIKKYDIQDGLLINFEQNTTVTPNVGGGGSEGQNIQGIEWGSEAVEYITTLRDQIANQLLSNGSR